MCVLCFFYVWNLSVKKTKKFKTALVTSFTLLLIKKLFLPIKTAIFTNSEQSKTPFGRNSVTYRTPCHARGHFVFYCYHVTYRTPCHAIGLLVIFTVSAADLRERFLLSGVFTLHSFLLVLSPTWGRKFNLNISRNSCWYFRNIPPAQLFAWIITIHRSVYSGISISLMTGWSRE